MTRVYNNSTGNLKVTMSYNDIVSLKDFFIIGPFDEYVTDQVMKQLDIIINDMNENDYDSVQWEINIK